jgi:RHS repeat-associated protein
VIAQLADDDNANIQNSYAYSPYGQSQTVGPDSANNPNQYTSRENDNTGLYYYRARYYDPVMKRFVSSDPIGLAGGWNTYEYVGGHPLSRLDPTGQFAMVIPFIPTIITGTDLVIGTGLGLLGYGLDRMFSAPPRGLPPEGINPPSDGQCTPGPASRPSERDKGGQSLWDNKGGEWRWSPGDKWHNPHWDQNSHDTPSSPWVNVPHGGLPPVKNK